VKPFREAGGYADDLQAAYDYYKSYSARAATRFLSAYLKEVAVVTSNPLVTHVRRHGWRQLTIRRHPRYAIFYKELPGFWLLGGVIATMRDPDQILVKLLIREIGND
jgi:plasmid stabilization system protein ParE